MKTILNTQEEKDTEMIRAEQLGKRVAILLNLKPLRGYKRTEYGTQFGEKTALGLGRTIINFIEESHDIKPKN